MDFQEFVNRFLVPTAVISVEKKGDSYGEIRIVTGNPKYLKEIETPSYPMPELPPNTVNKFIPDSLYYKYIPKDVGFEDICYRAAVLKKPVHTYVHLNALDMWFDIYMMPIDYEDGNIGYCSYTANPSTPDEIALSSSTSGSISEDVLRTCIKLHETNDLKETIQDITREIRLLCRSEVCTIMLVDNEKMTCSILASSKSETSKLKVVTQFSNFYEIAMSWIGMIGDGDCIIIRDEKDMKHISEINNPWYVTLEESGVKSVVMLPLRSNGEIIGFIWSTNFDTNNTMRIKETLELTAFFISSQIAHYNTVEKLKHISYTDVLTGLPNRPACAENLKALIKKNKPFAVVSADVNNFKSINDTMGFDTGNKVLVEVAARFRDVTANELDGVQVTVGRISGDQFALFISGYDSENMVTDVIRKYAAALEKRFYIDNYDFYITAGFGYVLYPDDSQNADSLRTYAVAAMKESKQSKSNEHILRFSAEMFKLERTIEIEREIRNALKNDTIYFNLQPQYDMDHNLRGFEALARMKDSQGRFISPGEFIPVSEKVGLIDKVDGTVFRKAAFFFGELIRSSGKNITLSINVSVKHMMKSDFLDEVRTVLKQSGVPASLLEIEITESIMIDSAEKALSCINELKKMGIKIAIDDFGTGYSSLSYLNCFPANILKIDKSFIDKMNTSDPSKQYVAAIISIGHIMGFDVISEGVEEPDQLDTLRDIGCDYIQGYIWGRPLPEDEARKLVLSPDQ